MLSRIISPARFIKEVTGNTSSDGQNQRGLGNSHPCTVGDFKEQKEGSQAEANGDGMEGGSTLPSIRSAESVAWQPCNSCGAHFLTFRAKVMGIYDKI